MTGRREGAAGAVTGFQPGGVARFLGTKNSGNRNKKIETQKLRAKRVFIAGEAISPPPPPPWANLATFIVPNVQGTLSGSLLGHKHWWFWKKKKCKKIFFLGSTLMAKHEKAKVNTWHVPWGLFLM